jgi:hypothetical protein
MFLPELTYRWELEMGESVCFRIGLKEVLGGGGKEGVHV